MKMKPAFALSFPRLFRALALSVVCCLFGRAPDCRAITIYSVAIDTTAWSGQNGTLAFDLIGGDAATANNTATIGSFVTNGTLNSVGDITLTDTGFFNEVLRGITFGSQLTFTLQLTESHTAPGLDQFSFFLLDPGTLLPLGATTDPTGANALFAIDITGGAGGNAMVFASSVPGVSWHLTSAPINPVPEDILTLPLAGCALGSLALFRFALRRRRRSKLSVSDDE
jgi:hypothetical protein